MPFPAMPTPVHCPKCDARFVVQVRTIIDVGEEPELKEEFLRGRVNYARCPQCGAGGALSAPLVYHDPAKELLITYVPAEVGMSMDDQERFVGSLVNAVMNATPQEARKGYFFRPRTALTLEGVYDAILEADGVSKEMLEAQRARVRLITQMLDALDSDEQLDALVEEHREELDYEFFLVLSSMIEPPGDEADEDGEAADEREPLRTLREKLLERVTPSMPTYARQAETYDDLIELLESTEPGDDWRTAVAVNRGRLDYGFFQALTGRIEAARGTGDTERAEALTDLRRRINEELDAQDDLVRAAEDRASIVIMEILEEDDLETAVRRHKDEIDEIFLMLLSRYRAVARQRENQSRADRLDALFRAAVDVLEEDLPPDVRLINKLVRAEHPDGTAALLEEHRALLTDDFLARYDRTVESLAGRDGELADHLKAIREQIVAKMTIQRA